MEVEPMRSTGEPREGGQVWVVASGVRGQVDSMAQGTSVPLHTICRVCTHTQQSTLRSANVPLKWVFDHTVRLGQMKKNHEKCYSKHPTWMQVFAHIAYFNRHDQYHRQQQQHQSPKKKRGKRTVLTC